MKTMLNHAINEYVSEYVDLHGSCQATRDEAHSEVATCEKVAKEAVAMARSHLPADEIEFAAEEIYRAILPSYRDRVLCSAFVSAILSDAS